MLQLSNCCLEYLKTWRNCNTGWEGIPLENCQWGKGVFVVIFASVDLTKCHGVAVSGNPVCGLNVVGEWHSHKAIDNFVEKTEPGY